MPLIVETGEGLANADSYVSVDQFNAYRQGVYGSAAGETPELVEAALRRATMYIDLKYIDKWIGYRTTGRTQALAWPRTVTNRGYREFLGIDEIPREIIQATCEAAIRELSSPGSLMPDYVSAERIIREKVGPIETQYAASGSPVPQVPIIDNLLRSLVSASAGSMTVFAQRA